MLLKVPSGETATVVATHTKHIGKLPAELRRSLTWDRCYEMAAHKVFIVATDVHVYFCDSRNLRHRDSNENTNVLLRPYFPRGAAIAQFSQAYLTKIAPRLYHNRERPWASNTLPIN